MRVGLQLDLTFSDHAAPTRFGRGHAEAEITSHQAEEATDDQTDADREHNDRQRCPRAEYDARQQAAAVGVAPEGLVEFESGSRETIAELRLGVVLDGQHVGEDGAEKYE